MFMYTGVHPLDQGRQKGLNRSPWQFFARACQAP